MDKNADKLQILIVVVVIIVLVLISGIGFVQKQKVYRLEQMVETAIKDARSHGPLPKDKVYDLSNKLSLESSDINDKIRDMLESKSVGEADTAKLNSSISKIDADNATFSGLDGMDTTEVKMQLD